MITAPLTAGEHVAEAALILRIAATIEDPYLRADRIWDAVEQLRESFAHSRTRICEEVTSALEAGCDGSSSPPVGEELGHDIRALERYARTLRGLAAAAPRGPGYAPRGADTDRLLEARR